MTVHFQVVLKNGTVGKASAQIVYSSPPVAGSCSVEPTSGFALLTDFSIVCESFTAPTGFSLTYEMYVSQQESVTDG